MDGSGAYWFLTSQSALLFPSASPLPEDGVEVVLACLRKMQAVVSNRAGRFYLVAHRYPENAGLLTDDLWASFVVRSGAVDISPHLRGRGAELIGFDGLHWNAAGHRLVASRVAELLERR